MAEPRELHFCLWLPLVMIVLFTMPFWIWFVPNDGAGSEVWWQ